MCECESDEHFVVAFVVCAVCACENNMCWLETQSRDLT